METGGRIPLRAGIEAPETTLILDNISDILIACDWQWRIIYLNAAAERCHGARNLFLGKSYWTAFPHLIETVVEREFRQAASERKAARFEFFDKPQNVWLEVEVFPIAGYKLVVCTREITKRKLAENSLRESEQRYRTLSDLSPDAILVHTGGRIVYANRAAWQLLGAASAEQLLGRAPLDFISPEYHQQVRERTARLLQRQSTDRVEQKWHRLDGTPTDVELSCGSVSWQGQPAILVLLRDLSGRKRGQAALRNSEERFRQLADAMPHLVWTAAPDGTIDYYNQRFREFRAVSSTDKHRWMPIVHPEDREATKAAWRQAVATGAPYEIEHRMQLASGEFHWHLSRGMPAVDEAGRVVRWYGTATDIHASKCAKDALRLAKEKAESASQAKSEFLANMSHEIRTPMTVFMAAVDHLLQIDRDPDHQVLLQMADEAAQRLLTLIDDILDLSRIEARRLEIEAAPFAVRECLDKVVEMLRLQALQKNLCLVIEVSPEVPAVVTGDSHRLGQILTNLIANAIKFTESGEVRVTVGIRNGSIEFAVADTGIGIPDEKKSLLFQNFSQLDSSFKRRYGGTGLGLAICKGLVDAMGGSIGADNRPGGGTVFTFTLPLKSDAGATDAPAKAAGGEESADIRILLAEDDPMVRDILLLTLQRRGWRTETADNGRKAVEKWRASVYDLVLMDLQMPEMTGMEATRTIRGLEANAERRTCIVGITAHARRETLDECLAAGMDKVLTKPIKIKDVERILGGVRTEVELGMAANGRSRPGPP